MEWNVFWKAVLTIEKCREILSRTNNELSDQQIEEIRDLLSAIADVTIQTYLPDGNYNE